MPTPPPAAGPRRPAFSPARSRLRAPLALSALLLVAAAHASSASSGPAAPTLLDRALPELVLSTPAVQARAGRSPASSPAAGQPPASAGSALLLARAGDTLESLARSYGVPTSALSGRKVPEGLAHAGGRAGEPLPQGAVIQVQLPAPAGPEGGQPGRLPPGVRVLLSRPGDTPGAVAASSGLSLGALLSANLDLTTLGHLPPGTPLYLPPDTRAGLLLRIKPGQSAAALVAAYGADPAATALANGIGLPDELGAGDLLLLPGVQARAFKQQLLARQQREQRAAARQARVQAQYGQFLAWEASPEQRARRAADEREDRDARLAAAGRALDEASGSGPKGSADLLALLEPGPLVPKYLPVEGEPSTFKRPLPLSPGEEARARTELGLGWPLKSYRITSGFGEQDIPLHQTYFHGGVDLAAPTGTPIYAAEGGTVRESGDGAYGTDVYVASGEALVIYGHMSATAVMVGQMVQRGDVLGYVGCTGLCTGPHLHFEVRWNGVPVDPLGLLPE